MAKRIYVFDEYGSSKQNGIGTYLRNLRLCLKEEAQVCMLSFNDDVGCIAEQDIDGVLYIRFPKFCGGAFLQNAEIGVALIRTMIDDKTENVFVVNHFPCNDLLRLLKKHYPLSKRVFVIHDQRWNEALMGDESRLRKIAGSPSTDKDIDPLSNVIHAYIEEEKGMYSLADAVVCLNSGTGDLLRDVYHVNPDKLFCIPNGADFLIDKRRKSAVRRKLLLREDDRAILFVGRTTDAKGIVAALKAFEMLVRSHPEALLVVIGEVFRLNEFAAMCPRSISRVVFAGHLNASQLRDWYKAADMGLISSYREQCGYAGIEMMAAGLSVVASDGGGIKQMFKDGENALVVRIGNRKNPKKYIKSLARAMAKMIEADNQDRKQMAQNGRRVYNNLFTINSMRKGYKQMLESFGSSKISASATLDKDCQLANLPCLQTLREVILHCCDIADNGLLNGKMGIALSLAEYARNCHCSAAEDVADFLVRRITNSLHRHGNISFGSGLSGIGWGIEYLAHNGFIKINTKDVCEEIDREIMRISPTRIADFSLESGLEGILVYVNAHLHSNIASPPFDAKYIGELNLSVRNHIESGQACDSFQEQAKIFFAIIDGQDCTINMDLLQFVAVQSGSFTYYNGFGLQKGLAGKFTAEWPVFRQ